MSELGFVYLLASIETMKVLRVCDPRQNHESISRVKVHAYVQRMQIRHAIWMSQGRDRLCKQLPRLVLEMQQVIGPYLVQYLQ